MKRKYFIICIHQDDILVYIKKFIILHLIIIHHKTEIKRSLPLNMELTQFPTSNKNIYILHKPLIYWLFKLETYFTIKLFIRIIQQVIHNDTMIIHACS